MARTIDLKPAIDVQTADISVNRDEPTILRFSGNPGDLVMTISTSADGDPIVEIPGINEISVPPERVATLTEGRSYQMNIWRRPSSSLRLLMFRGQFRTASTIAPMDVEYPTQWLEGAKAIIGPITQAEYDAIDPHDDSAVYVVVD